MPIFDGARVTLVSQWGRFTLTLLGFVVLARLLPPVDFGLIAMVAPIVTIAAVFSDFGLSLAGIQAEHLTGDQKSNLFWMNIGAGALATAVVAGAGPLLAAFYDEPRVVPLTLLIALSLLITSCYLQFRVELNRRNKFGSLALQDFVSALVGLVGAVSGALAGIGVWALAMQPVLQSLCVLIMAATQAKWVPGMPNRSGPVRGLLVFGGHNFLLQATNLLSRTVDAMMVGRYSGAGALGQYSRGSQLVSLAIVQVVSPLTRVVMPWLSRTEPGPRFVQTLTAIQRLIGYAVLAVLSLIVAVAPASIVVVLGSDWTPMVGIVRILCLGAVFQALGYIYYWALLSRARTGLLVLSELPGRLVMVIGAIVAAPFGPTWVATAVAFGQFVIFVVSTIVVGRIGVPSSLMLITAGRPAMVYSAAAAGAAAVVNALGVSVLSLSTGVLAWLAVCGAFLFVPVVRRDVRAALNSTRGRR